MIKPFLKWAGGKRWIVSNDQLPVPQTYTRYVEPFLGGGAVFFHLQPEKAHLSDLNGDLIHLYLVMRDEPEKLWATMKNHHRQHSKDYYYKIRAMSPRTDITKAAQFLYLNRTCWNGLYRVNLKGEFNVPIGTKDTVIFDDDDFLGIAKILKNAEIKKSDFEGVLDSCGMGDFVFIDPPYTVQHNFNNFVKYNEKIFSWDDQIRLRDAVQRAAGRGAHIAVTNADHETIRTLYKNIGVYDQVSRQSVLSSDPSKRGQTTEALFVSFSG